MPNQVKQKQRKPIFCGRQPQEKFLGLYVNEYLPDQWIMIGAYEEHWYTLPNREIKDDEPKNRLIASGYSVLEFWESDFKKLELVKRKIVDAI